MASSLLTMLITAGVVLVSGQDEVPMQVVEGFSSNVNILCDLTRQPDPLYWRINSSVFDLYSVPAIFETDGFASLTIPTVNRHMDGWTFQCFTLSTQQRQIYSQITVLSVIIVEPSNSPAVPSLQPALEGRLILDYQQLEFGPDNATLRWQYFPDPSAPCTDTRYRVELSKFEDITNAQFENELEPFQVIESARKSFSLPVNFVNVEENYFRVSAIDASNSTCARMEYYTALLDNGKNTATELYVPTADNIASFDIPEDLHNFPSLQLIWTKSNHTPCVCPVTPNLTSDCACNKNDPENLVTVSGNRMTVSNLSDQLDQVLLYFVSSNASGCQQRCFVRSVAQTYRLIIRGPPESLMLSYMDQRLCFNSSVHPAYPAEYLVNITDVTSSLIFRHIYNTSQCLENFYLCGEGPFTVSVTARNRFEETSISQQLDIGIDPLQVNVSSVTSTSATIRLTCPSEYTEVTTTLVIQAQDRADRTISAQCNETQDVGSLSPAVSYNISRDYSGASSTCNLRSFVLINEEYNKSGTTIIAAVVTSLLILLLTVTTAVIIAIVVYHHHHTKNFPVTKSPAGTLTRTSIPPSQSFQQILNNAQESDDEQSNQSFSEENELEKSDDELSNQSFSEENELEQSNPLYKIVNNPQDPETGQQWLDGPKTEV